MMSAKLIPEYATSIAISSSPGEGTGPSRSSSAPEGPYFSIAIYRRVMGAPGWSQHNHPSAPGSANRCRLWLALFGRDDDDAAGSILPVELYRGRSSFEHLDCLDDVRIDVVERRRRGGGRRIGRCDRSRGGDSHPVD